jgi:hypothetical protein
MHESDALWICAWLLSKPGATSLGGRLVATDDRLLFYSDADDEFGNEPMVDQIGRELRERPELERTELERRYRLTFRIAEVLRRMVPRVSPTPTIVCYSRDEVGPVHEVHVPRLERQEPVARRRGKSVKAVELEDLVRSLTGPERERVRGYVEAIVEQRGG